MKKYNRLTILKEEAGKRTMVFCRCDCGTEKWYRKDNVTNGHTKSCGCFKRERSPVINRTHGMSRTRTSKSWEGMRQRCNNSNNADFPRYGGRGIRVCERWDESFDNFFADMGECPAGMSIERIDNDGNYEPGNCRWASKREQASNRRTSRFVTAHGMTLTIKEWATLLGLAYVPLYKKFMRRGFPKIDPGLLPKPKDSNEKV